MLVSAYEPNNARNILVGIIFSSEFEQRVNYKSGLQYPNREQAEKIATQTTPIDR